MGAFMIMDIEFVTEKDRKKFEELNHISKKDILVDENSDSSHFITWAMLRNPLLNPIYFMGFMGYAKSNDIINECKKNKIDVKFCAWIPINDKGAEWEKIIGKW